MARLFGFSIEDNEKKSKSIVSPVPVNNEDGVDHYIASNFYGQYLDLEGVYKSEFELVKRYREMALHPEADTAIEDVVNEAIVSDLNDTPVTINLENLPASDGIKKRIREEFKVIKDLMNFDAKSHEIFRNWYVDGRVYYHKVIDIKKPEEGIQELRYIDPLKMRYVREEKKSKQDQNNGNAIFRQPNGAQQKEVVQFPEIEEYFMYMPRPTYAGGMGDRYSGTKGIKFSKDSITYCTSGLVDRNKGVVLSYLHKAIKSLNQLRMIEDSLVIYRLSRAPERRIFYIDVGNLPKIKAEQYLKDVMNRYRNKLVYDASTGEVRDDRKHMSMLEDFWLPRREGGRGTEITTLPGGQNLGELSDVAYFQKKLYRSLSVPESRIGAEGGFNLGRSSEILRDELKFSKFVGRLRKRFSNMFIDMLKTQCLLKNICTTKDWVTLEEHIQFDYIYDNHFAELKEKELLEGRLSAAQLAEPYLGKYYSVEYLRRKVLHQTDEEIIEIDQQIEKEILSGILPDPNAPVDEMGNPIPQDATGGMGEIPMDDEADGGYTEADGRAAEI